MNVNWRIVPVVGTVLLSRLMIFYPPYFPPKENKERKDSMEPKEIQKLAITATKGRLLGLSAIHRAASGHTGGSLSVMDILTVLYFHEMKVNPERPRDPERDRLVMSKGHCTPALYSVLALRGFFPVEDMQLFRSIDGHYSGHPDMVHVKGVDMSTGSLGQGLSAAVGMALAGKLDRKDYRVYAVLGDGELDEGQIWEAAMAASAFHTDNLVAIVDQNGLQANGRVVDRFNTNPLPEKWAAFGWHVIEIDGHDMGQIVDALDAADTVKGQPTVIIAHTVKGKGLSFAENQVKFHNGTLTEETYQQALAELA